MKNYTLIPIFDYLDIEGLSIDYEGGKNMAEFRNGSDIKSLEANIKMIRNKKNTIIIVEHQLFLKTLLDIEEKYVYNFFA